MTLYIKICEAGWRLIELENIAFYVKTETIKLVGVFGTLIGLYDAFAAIESIGSVSQGILAGGLKVASTTTLYGLLVYIISRILHLIS